LKEGGAKHGKLGKRRGCVVWKEEAPVYDCGPNGSWLKFKKKSCLECFLCFQCADVKNKFKK
jgi:hypothetical protein